MTPLAHGHHEQVDLVYDTAYLADDLPHFRRLGQTWALAVGLGLARGHAPDPLPDGLLEQLHDPLYVDAVRRGIAPLCNSAYLPWSPALVRACEAMLGGQLSAARIARRSGLCVNLACGFHHAHPQRGGGYCVFNGLALVALAHPELKVAVLDCDEHGGDGTEAYCALLPNLRAISVFGTRFGITGGERSLALRVPRDASGAAEPAGYLEVLDEALGRLLDDPPDLVLYQASADTHSADPRASLKLSTATLARRDQCVFATLRAAAIPVVVTLAGGYQAPGDVAALYLQTLRIAAGAWVR